MEPQATTSKYNKMKMMKEYIGYDKLIDKLVQEKKRQLIKCRCDILELELQIEGLHLDIERIRKEQEESNLGKLLYHIYLDPYAEYNKLLKSIN